LNSTENLDIYFYKSIDMYTFIFRSIMIYLFAQVIWYLIGIYFFYSSIQDPSDSSSSSSPLGLLGAAGGIKTTGYYEEADHSHYRYDDVIGMNPIKEDLKLISTIFRYNTIFFKQGVNIPKGLLFTGPPGVGKTMMAKAFAGEARCKFYSISGSDFKHPLVGVGGMIVKDLFETAKKNAPAVIFIDEIDAVGSKRSASLTSSGESSTTLNKILEQMDGFSTYNDQILVIGATNRP
jgi:cell division protease FtsH